MRAGGGPFCSAVAGRKLLGLFADCPIDRRRKDGSIDRKEGRKEERKETPRKCNFANKRHRHIVVVVVRVRLPLLTQSANLCSHPLFLSFFLPVSRERIINPYHVSSPNRCRQRQGRARSRLPSPDRPKKKSDLFLVRTPLAKQRQYGRLLVVVGMLTFYLTNMLMVLQWSMEIAKLLVNQIAIIPTTTRKQTV